MKKPSPSLHRKKGIPVTDETNLPHRLSKETSLRSVDSNRLHGGVHFRHVLAQDHLHHGVGTGIVVSMGGAFVRAGRPVAEVPFVVVGIGGTGGKCDRRASGHVGGAGGEASDRLLYFLVFFTGSN
jgi:hypothetical protein